MNPNLPGPTDEETLAGGATFSAIHTDGTHSGVFLRQIPIASLGQYYLLSQSDPNATIELLANAKHGWAATLTPASQLGILEEGERINRDFLRRWREQQDRLSALAPKADTEQTAAMLRVLQDSNPDLLRSIVERALPPLPRSAPSSLD